MKLVAWAEGDRTVGDGTFNAELTVDTNTDPRDVEFAKNILRTLLEGLWDVKGSRIHIMTEEEHDAYTRAEDENG